MDINSNFIVLEYTLSNSQNGEQTRKRTRDMGIQYEIYFSLIKSS